MAWKNREGGDKGHTNGVHYANNVETKAFKAFVKDTLTPDLVRHVTSQIDLFSPPSATPEECSEALHARLSDLGRVVERNGAALRLHLTVGPDL